MAEPDLTEARFHASKALECVDRVAAELRLETGVSSCEAVGELLGVSRQAISRWQRGGLETVDALRTIAAWSHADDS